MKLFSIFKEKSALVHEIKMKECEIEQLKRDLEYYLKERALVIDCAKTWHRLYNDLLLRSSQESQIFHEALTEAIESRKNKIMGFK